MLNLTKEAFDEWKEHPVTKEIFNEIQKVKTALLNDVSAGATVGHSADVTHGLTNRMIGHIEGLDQLLNISFVSESEEDSE